MEPKQIRELIPAKVDILSAFDEVVLTKDEEALALLEARQRKYAKIKGEQYARSLAEPKKTYPKLKAEELWEKLAREIEGFKVDEFNKDIVWQLCLYFTRDVRSPLKLDKGLALMGPIGCGKSTIMRFFRHNQSNSYAFFSVRDISESYQKGGAEAVVRFKAKIPTSDVEETYGQEFIGACFDDLGEEDDKKHYGNEVNVMADILLTRYDRMREEHHKTHITTNLNASEIGGRYGDRLRSRMREMFNMVAFDEKAPDRRK